MKIAKPMTTALESAKSVLSEREKIRGKIREANTRLLQIEHEEKQAFERWGLELADAALQPDGESGVAPAESTLKFLQNEKTILAAQLKGLENKLRATEDTILEKIEALRTPRSQFIEGLVVDFAGEYRNAAEIFIRVARRGAVLAEALGIDLPGLSEIVVPQPSDLTKALIRLEETRFENGHHVRLIPRDAESERLFAELSPITELSRALSREAEQIRKQRFEEQQARLTAEHEKEPAIRHSPLPISAYAAQKYDEAEAERERARRASRGEIVNGNQYPNNPEKRHGLVAGHTFPAGTGSGKPEHGVGGSGKPQ